MNGHVDAARVLIRAGASVDHAIVVPPKTPELKSKGKRSILHIACSWGHTDCVKLLLENGANPHVLDNEGCTPLQQAQARGYSEASALLC